MARRAILVVEDNPLHRRILKTRLERPDVNLTVVPNATGFLEAVQQRDFDCIVMDYELPGGCADGLLASARSYLHECPVIVISSYREQEVAVTVLREGGFDFLSKEVAFSGDELWRRVEVALVKGRSRRLERRRHERRERHLARLAEIDHLTGLANRRYFDRCMSESRWSNDRRKHLSAVLFDIDHFKRVNDTFGHPAGDAALRAVAEGLRNWSTRQDVLIRWGGEEVLVVRESPSPLEAWLWADGLRRQIESMQVPVGGQAIQITISASVLHCQGTDFSLEGIDAADKALYLAKQQGRNRVYTADMAVVAQELAILRERSDLSPLERWGKLMERLGPLIGPVRGRHIVAHGERVRDIAEKVARNLKLGEADVQRIAESGLIHDTGHCLIPEELFSKPSTLTIDEYRLMRSHDQFSAWIAQSLGFDKAVTDSVRHHHGRYKLAGAKSEFSVQGDADQGPPPIGARLVCAADALVAMVSKRPYGPTRSVDGALNELQRAQGAQFDPDIVRAIGAIQRLDHLLAA